MSGMLVRNYFADGLLQRQLHSPFTPPTSAHRGSAGGTSISVEDQRDRYRFASAGGQQFGTTGSRAAGGGPHQTPLGDRRQLRHSPRPFPQAGSSSPSTASLTSINAKHKARCSSDDVVINIPGSDAPQLPERGRASHLTSGRSDGRGLSPSLNGLDESYATPSQLIHTVSAPLPFFLLPSDARPRSDPEAAAGTATSGGGTRDIPVSPAAEGKFARWQRRLWWSTAGGAPVREADGAPERATEDDLPPISPSNTVTAGGVGRTLRRTTTRGGARSSRGTRSLRTSMGENIPPELRRRLTREFGSQRTKKIRTYNDLHTW